jgi:hypothetical protein
VRIAVTIARLRADPKRARLARSGDHVRGLEAIGRFFEGLRPYLGDDHQVAVDELADAGERVVALVHHRRTAPGGAPYDVSSIMVWTMLYEQLDMLAMHARPRTRRPRPERRDGLSAGGRRARPRPPAARAHRRASRSASSGS